MKKKKANISVLKALWTVLLEMLYSFKYNVVKELDKIAVIIEIAIPVVLSQIYADITKLIIVSIVMTVIVHYITKVGQKLNNETYGDLPLPRYRMTKIDSDGFVSLIDQDDLQELVLYMHEVEQYLTKKGKLK
jgi:hypothetical protein